MGAELAILFLWAACLAAGVAVLVRMLIARRHLEAVGVVLAGSVGCAAVFLPAGMDVLPVLALLGLCTAGLSLGSLSLEWRVPVLLFGLIVPLLGALSLTSVSLPMFVQFLGEIVLVCMPLLFVLSTVFLTGALVRRHSGGSV